MNTLTWKEAYDKIIQAYFRDEIEPYNSNFCFCGTLAAECYSAEGYKNWNNHDGKFNKLRQPYTLKAYGKMEQALFGPLNAAGSKPFNIGYGGKLMPGDDNYEDALFDGMCAALEVLKDIHRRRGENVDQVPEFKKRVVSHSLIE